MFLYAAHSFDGKIAFYANADSLPKIINNILLETASIRQNLNLYALDIYHQYITIPKEPADDKERYVELHFIIASPSGEDTRKASDKLPEICREALKGSKLQCIYKGEDYYISQGAQKYLSKKYEIR